MRALLLLLLLSCAAPSATPCIDCCEKLCAQAGREMERAEWVSPIEMKCACAGRVVASCAPLAAGPLSH